MTTTAQQAKRCTECGEVKDDVLGKQDLCGDCENRMVYCQVCDEYSHECRHVGWINDFGCHCGCGTQDIKADDHKESFVEVLKALAPLKDYWGKEPLVRAMLRFIKANNFWTFWHGPMIGWPPTLGFRYEKDFK